MQEQTIFTEALEKDDPAERAAFLDGACGGDAHLRQRIERLLGQHDHASSFLEQPVLSGDATDYRQPPISEQPGSVIGPYKLLQQIGEGGMGVVFMAEQTEPIQRTVALKIIKPGMDTRQVIARIEAERQALAMMDHPNIAKVFDAGATDSGRPYLVMELVKGTPITKYCDEKQLPLGDRLELFMPVCQAVQHAHQKGIIHRDIKPTNVLVAEYDNHAIPKVIDFGVAKATAQKLAERTMFTEFGQVIGTVEYMSPEQAKLNQLDIDTRSDIYSLGVLLYELLTGTTPFERKRLQEAAFDEMLRIIREEEPLMPSTKLSSSDTLPSIAANRHTEPSRLSKEVRGELDWIVMKALEKDRNRRYETANGMAYDIRRYLADEPVLARPSTQLYRLRKFAHRNKVGVMVGSAVAMVLVASLAIASIGFVQARHQARIAAAEAIRATDAKGRTEVALAEKSIALQEKAVALQLAEEKEQLQRRRFYAAQMNLAHQALVAGDPARVLDLLDHQRPLAGEPDLRGFEWYYLWREIHPGLRRMLLCPSWVSHWALAISPDGETVAIADYTAEKGHQVKMFDAGSGVLTCEVSHLPDQVAALSFSPDGLSLAGGAFDQHIYIWSIPSGRQIAHAMLPGTIVRACGFSPDGKHLVAGADNGAIRIYEAATLNVVAELKPHGADSPVSNAFYTPDGTKVITSAAWGSEGILTRIHDVTKRPPTVIDELLDFRATDVSPDGRLLVGGWQKVMSVHDIVERKLVWQQPNAHAGVIKDARFTPDGTSIISAGEADRQAIIWNLAERKEVMRLPHPFDLSRVAVAGAESEIWASLSDDGTAKIWELKTRPDQGMINKKTNLPHPSMVDMLDGRSVILGGDNPTEIWDLKSQTHRNNPSAATDVRSISADGRWLASVEYTGPEDGYYVAIWDMTSGERRHRIATRDNHKPRVVRISPDGRFLAIGDPIQKPIQLWDVSGEPSKLAAPVAIRHIVAPPGGECGTIDFVFSPDGHFLAIGYQFGFVNLYNLETNRNTPLPMRGVSGGTTWVSRVAFSKDGNLLAAGDHLGLVRIFDVELGEVIATLSGHEATISAFAFFPDGKTLAVGSHGTIRLWDVHSSQERITLQLPRYSKASRPIFVYDLVVTHDGRTLISRHSNDSLKIWHAAGELADLAIKPRAQLDRPKTAENDPLVHTRRAIFHTSIGNWERALANWKRAQELGVHWDAALVTRLMQTIPTEERAAKLRDPDAARRLRQQVMSQGLPSEDARELNGIAWEIVRNAELSRYAVEFAVQAAEKAMKIAPDDGPIVNTLGVANYRAGQWQSAIESMEKSLDLQGDNGRDWFFLAMAHWQLGHKAEARQSYDKAIAWMNENARLDEELHRFRAEADELLGINETQSPTRPKPLENEVPNTDNPASASPPTTDD